MSMEWLNANSGGGDGGRGLFFDVVGAKVIGVITATPRRQETKYGERLVVELRVQEGSTAKKGEKGAEGSVLVGEDVTLWVRPGPMAQALRDAVSQAGAKGLTEGDTLAVKLTEEQDIGKPSKLKVYKAQYIVSKVAVPVDGDGEEPF